MNPTADSLRLSGRPRVVVVGGGLAGMASAVALDSAGADVTLLEARRRLGGRAGSFEDPQTGQELDNCQHVLLGCCTNLLDFYCRIDALELVRFEPAVHFFDPAGRRYDLRPRVALPAPIHLASSMLRFDALTWRERVALARAMAVMMRLGPGGRAALEGLPFGDWLDEQRQPAGLVDKLYEPLLTGSLNEQCRRASSAYAIQVFQDALLSHVDGCRLGLPAVPLTRLYARLPFRDVRLGVRAARLVLEGDRVASVELAGGATIDADAIVLALNHHTLDKLLPPEALSRDGRFKGLGQLVDSPILGAHLWFDRPVMRESHAAFIAGPLQWLFRKNADGSIVHGVISAARDWVARPREQCLALFERQLRSTLPLARSARLLRGVIVIEKRATFSPLPGADAFRPEQAPPPDGIENLYLAGDYTRTGWPATMEGAVRSGYLAAEALLARFGAPAGFLRPDLPPQWPTRFLRRT